MKGLNKLHAVLTTYLLVCMSVSHSQVAQTPPMGWNSYNCFGSAVHGQTKSGRGLWHVSASSDGRWAVGDDFSRNIYLIDRDTSEMMLLSAGHKTTAADHPHPTMSPDGTKIQIQTAMLSADNRTMNICIVPVPEEWLKRTYKK